MSQLGNSDEVSKFAAKSMYRFNTLGISFLSFSYRPAKVIQRVRQVDVGTWSVGSLSWDIIEVKFPVTQYQVMRLILPSSRWSLNTLIYYELLLHKLQVMEAKSRNISNTLDPRHRPAFHLSTYANSSFRSKFSSQVRHSWQWKYGSRLLQ